MKNEAFSKTGTRAGARPGFTLVELLVTVAIMAVLVSLAFIATKRALISGRKVADLNNVRQLAAVSIAMAGEQGSAMPKLHSTSSSNPYWFSMDARRKMETNGVNREACYAPTRDLTGGKPDYDWWDLEETSTAFHYAYLIDDSQDGTPWYGDAAGVVPPDSDDWRGDPEVLNNGRPFARTLGDQVWYPIIWAGLCIDTADKQLICAIMEHGAPLGINVVYLDGSAKWVPWSDMKERYKGGQETMYW